MKRSLVICTIVVSSLSFALDWSDQVIVEKVYDNMRESMLAGKTRNEQVAMLKKIQSLLKEYETAGNRTERTIQSIKYLGNLFCQTQSLLVGLPCENAYYPSSNLTKDIKEYSLAQLRVLLLGEHNNRRKERGLWTLKGSEILNTVAQNYALKLCEADTISHTLNGSTLSQRLQDEWYIYTAVGENLWLWQRSVMELLDQLTTSIGHRTNMYFPDYTELGIGQCSDIWVLVYGTPKKA